MPGKPYLHDRSPTTRVFQHSGARSSTLRFGNSEYRLVDEGKVTRLRVVRPMSQHAGEFEMPALVFRLCPRNQVKEDKKESENRETGQMAFQLHDRLSPVDYLASITSIGAKAELVPFT